MTATDLLRRAWALVAGAATLALFAGAGLAILSVLQDQVNGIAVVIFLVIALVFLFVVMLPLVSLVHGLWEKGNPHLRARTNDRIAKERQDVVVRQELERRRRAGHRPQSSD